VTDPSALHDAVVTPGTVDLGGVARVFTDVFEADGTVVFVVDPDRRQLEVGASQPPGGVDERDLRIPLGYGVTGLVAMNGRPVTLVDDTPRNRAHQRLLGLVPGGTVCRLCVPARGIGSAIVGVIAIHRHRRVAFTDADAHRAQRFADLVGLRLHAESLLEAAEEHRSQRDHLIAHATSAQEAERRRIAGDLHDGVTQALASLAFHLSAADVGLSALADTEPSAAEAKLQIQSARRLACLAYDETRVAISGLHSLLLDDLGLVAALESLTKNVPQLHIELRGDPAAGIELPDHCAAVLYRIAQEAINNSVKHAEAQHAVLSIRRVGDALVLRVSDDGIGFDVEKARADARSATSEEHYGLSSIAERCALIGATLRIDSAEGRGTAVTVELPVRPA